MTRHKNRKYRCDVLRTGGNQVCKGMRLNRRNSDDFNQDDFYGGGESPSQNSNEDDTSPTIDGDEFCGNKSLTRQTIVRMMKLLKIPKQRWNRIATGILEEDQVKRTRMGNIFVRKLNCISFIKSFDCRRSNIIIMSFFDNKNPEKRDAMSEDYLALKKQLKERNLEERGDLMDLRRDLQETFEPVVASNEQMVRDITKDLEPITEGIQELNRNLEICEVQRTSPLIGGKRKRESKYGPLAAGFYRNYFNPNGQMNKTFGIHYADGKHKIGDKLIDIIGDNIVINDEVYIGTPGLWSLITDKTSKEYDDNDYKR